VDLWLAGERGGTDWEGCREFSMINVSIVMMLAGIIHSTYISQTLKIFKAV
jgi:hypothetical protein